MTFSVHLVFTVRKTLGEEMTGREATRLESFWANVEKAPGDGCWLWTAGRTTGYGVVGLPIAGERRAHRIAYVLQNGPVPDGLVLDHLCRNRACVNPDHLEPVTHAENILRGVSPTAKNAVKTHCKYGHEFTPENTKQKKHGRACRECERRINRETARRAYARTRTEASA